MNTFRTELTLKPQPTKLTLASQIITAGSCFAEVMGNKLTNYKVNTLVNPFGTIFNPISLFRLLQAAVNPQKEFTGELVQRDGYWFAYDLHSIFTASTREELLQQIQSAIVLTHQFLKTADTLILTFGTAVGYVHKETGQLVANCHKLPQNIFEKKLFTLPELLPAFSQLYSLLQAFNPNLQLLVTVSPVRHVKETLELNSVSKAILRVFCHELSQQYPNISYFPAYELMLDDLRDYRFYKADMIHPDEVAEMYIWDKFKNAFFDENFQHFTSEWDKIQQALTHRPFQPESAAHQTFLRQTLARLEHLLRRINCQAEIQLVKSQLT